MRNPEEIKKGLKHCDKHGDRPDCGDCPYYCENGCMDTVVRDALEYIEQLEAGVERVYKLTMALEAALMGGDRT